MAEPKNLKNRIKIFIIIILIGVVLSKCDLPKPNYNLIGPGILYTPL